MVFIVDLDIEVPPAKTGDRMAGVVDDDDIEQRGHIDGCLKPGRPILSSSRRREREHEQHAPSAGSV
jgi:hypothetical protein